MEGNRRGNFQIVKENEGGFISSLKPDWGSGELIKLFRLVSLEERIGLRDNMKILDVGCGDGRHLSNLHANNLLRVGLDINRIKLRHKRANVVFLLGDACYLPFRDKSFDIVMSRQFVSHVWNLDETIKEMIRVSSQTIYTEDSNVLNPVVFLSLLLKFGISWLWKKGKFHRISKLEDIHSVFWWKRKIRVPIKILTRKEFQNPLLNILWKYFGTDCIFSFKGGNDG